AKNKRGVLVINVFSRFFIAFFYRCRRYEERHRQTQTNTESLQAHCYFEPDEAGTRATTVGLCIPLIDVCACVGARAVLAAAGAAAEAREVVVEGGAGAAVAVGPAYPEAPWP